MAEKEDFNCIRATINEDASAVTLQIWLKGSPKTWIEYNFEQLSELIELLEKKRAELEARSN